VSDEIYEYNDNLEPVLYKKNIELVEEVQRRTTKLIDDVRNLHYEERIKKIKFNDIRKKA